MGRPKRLLYCDRYAHTFSHVVEGVRFTDEDKEMLERDLKAIISKHGFTIHYYSFLDTHIHLENEFYIDRSCGKELQIIKQSMTWTYNDHHKRRGPLWRERYKDVTILGDDHQWRTFFYILLNQFNAGIIDNLDDERFSSYAAYATGVPDGITSFLPEYIESAATPAERQAIFKQNAQDAVSMVTDVNAYERMEKACTYVGKNKVKLIDLVRLQDYEEKYLIGTKNDVTDKETITIILPGSPKASSEPDQPPEPTAEPSEIIIQDDADDLERNLKAKGIPPRVTRLFYGPKEEIIKAVKKHYKTFRLQIPP